MVKNHSAYLSKHPEKREDISYTLAERRERLKYRAFSVSDDACQLGEPATVTSQGIEQAAFVFTGQGAQWLVPPKFSEQKADNGKG